MRGGIFESFVIAELFKEYYNQGKDPHLYFWLDKEGHEIDCLIEKGQSITPIEIKSNTIIHPNYFANLNYWNDKAGKDREKSYIIYAGNENQLYANGAAISWQLIPTILDKTFASQEEDNHKKL